jgi:hypothetical protein
LPNRRVSNRAVPSRDLPQSNAICSILIAIFFPLALAWQQSAPCTHTLLVSKSVDRLDREVEEVRITWTPTPPPPRLLFSYCKFCPFINDICFIWEQISLGVTAFIPVLQNGT